MKTLDLQCYNVSEIDIIDTRTIDGGFDEEAYNAGKAVGEYVGKIIAGVGILAFFFAL